LPRIRPETSGIAPSTLPETPAASLWHRVLEPASKAAHASVQSVKSIRFREYD
jgi:hypothetical protein